MGIKASMNAVTFSGTHVANAVKVGNNLTSTAAEAQLQATELIRTLTLLLATIPAGDTANIATIQAQITALS